MGDRITVLFPIAELVVGGAEQQLLELVKGLDKNCFRPIVLTLFPGRALDREFKEVPQVEVISLERRGKYDFASLFKVFGILRRMRVDVVQPFLTPATFFGLLPALLCRTPVKIVTERTGPNKDAHLGYRLYLKAEDILTRFADWIVPNSEAGRENLIQRGIDPSRIKVIYNGINLSRLTTDNHRAEQVRQRLDLPPEGKVVGMIARMFPVKGHATFLQAAALINRAMPEVRFALVGDGPLRGHLEDLSRELGLGAKVTFFGEQRDVGAYLSALDIAALTSNNEGCSNFLLEAMALGKPVVATDAGGNRELVRHGETGFLIPPGDAEALAKAIITLLQHPEIASSMGQRGKERAIAQFSLERMVHEYEILYEETLRQKARRVRARAVG